MGGDLSGGEPEHLGNFSRITGCGVTTYIIAEKHKVYNRFAVIGPKPAALEVHRAVYGYTRFLQDFAF